MRLDARGADAVHRYARAIDRPPRILVLCTANQCRSPMAAALLARRLEESSVVAEVVSAGLMSGGKPAWPESAAVMEERGVDLSGHRSRRMSPDDVAGADLVIAMAREHLREAVVLEPSAFARSFTLKELARVGGSQPRRDAELDVWLAMLSAGRRPDQLLGANSADDVEDPIGRSMKAFRETADELELLIDRVVRAAWEDG